MLYPYAKLRRQIVEVGRKLYEKGFVASNDGNISVRLPNGNILITPTGVSKGSLRAGGLCVIDPNGKLLSGRARPSSEYKMHLEVYKRRPDVNACVHAHPQKATAFAAAGLRFQTLALPEALFSLGTVALTDYATPSSDELPKRIGEKVGASDALLLANHGALTLGRDVMEAYYRMEALEHVAAITLYARLLGGEKPLPPSERERLVQVLTEVYGKPIPPDLR